MSASGLVSWCCRVGGRRGEGEGGGEGEGAREREGKERNRKRMRCVQMYMLYTQVHILYMLIALFKVNGVIVYDNSVRNTIHLYV